MMNAIMVSLTNAPINAYTWTWGAIAIYAFSIKSFATYRRTKNPLARIYTYLGLSFATGLLLYGLPGIITRDPHILRITYFCADGFVQLSLQFGIWLLWFIGMHARISLRYLLACTIPISLATMIIEVLTSTVRVSQSPHLIIYSDKFPVLVLKSIMYIVVALPLAYFLLKQVPNQLTTRAKIQSFIAGTIFIIVCVAATSNNIFDKGSDTIQSSRDLAIFFTIFLLVQLPRRMHRR
jgi:hypothetical protein